MNNILIGRSAVYTDVRTRYDDNKSKMVEVSRTAHKGIIVAFTTQGSNNYPVVVMLYDDGGLRSHELHTVTVEGNETPAGPYR